MPVPYVFVGSSHEVSAQSQELVDELELRLPNRADLEPWSKRGVFADGSVLIVELEQKAAKADFSVFLLTETSEGGASPNVLFELGLFMGSLERYRTMIVWDERVALPTDLGGVLILKLSDGMASLADRIAENIENKGVRIRQEVELGSLERMLNVCTPGYADRLTPGVQQLHPRPDGSERFTSATDFFELCRCLLHRYVIGSMGPEQMGVLRAYFAIFLGDRPMVEFEGDRRPLERCETRIGNEPGEEQAVPGSFVIAISNPHDSRPLAGIAPRTGLSIGKLFRPNWRVGMPIPGYDGTRAVSTCAAAFAERQEIRSQKSDGRNVAVADEQEVIAIPVLWNERSHSASIGVLAMSSAVEGLLSPRFEPWVQRLRLVANVLGVAVDRLSREPLADDERLIGIDVNDSEDQRSFTRRAIGVRRAIAAHAVHELERNQMVRIEERDDELVLVQSD